MPQLNAAKLQVRDLWLLLPGHSCPKVCYIPLLDMYGIKLVIEWYVPRGPEQRRADVTGGSQARPGLAIRPAADLSCYLRQHRYYKLQKHTR
jgi:hypothetical protein